MQRELSPELFGDAKPARSNRGEVIVPAGNHLQTQETANFLNLDKQIFELKQVVLSLGEELKKIGSQLQEVVKTNHLRSEKIQSQMSRLEQSHNGMALEVGQKFQNMSLRLGERKALDQKIQEMVDRHTQVIKSFEVRMGHLQRLLAEKEGQVVHAQTTLNEMRMELARLKRI